MTTVLCRIKAYAVSKLLLLSKRCQLLSRGSDTIWPLERLFLRISASFNLAHIQMQLSVDWESWSFHKLLQRNQHTCIAACFIISCIQNELFRQCLFCNKRTCKWGGMEIENNDLTILGYCWLFWHLIWNADGNIC